jgi:hypothetical protein
MRRERPLRKEVMAPRLEGVAHNGKRCRIVALPPHVRIENHSGPILPVTPARAGHSKISEAQVKGRGSGILHPASSLGG